MDPLKQSREGKLLDALLILCATYLATIGKMDAVLIGIVFTQIVGGRNVVGAMTKTVGAMTSGGGSGPSDRPPPGGGGTGSSGRLAAVVPPPTTERSADTFVKRVLGTLATSGAGVMALGLANALLETVESFARRVRRSPLGLAVVLLIGCGGIHG